MKINKKKLDGVKGNKKGHNLEVGLYDKMVERKLSRAEQKINDRRTVQKESFKGQVKRKKQGLERKNMLLSTKKTSVEFKIQKVSQDWLERE